ncbi:uncharacterized protein LOC112459124 [Temnothorax curvispinosus]|uniref:Uncharacterized protein LOC112459124 n=1 Tax=Temnothorax curvispinosus TaxID=300111 RepID=A0A6J1QAZ4_9HYME|nr:uncharacterized protein LOC112459124 [Temnothorax curvispinosus]
MYLFILKKKILVDFLKNSSDGNDGNDDGNNDGNDDEVLQCVDDFEIEKTVNINKRINKKNCEKVSLNFDDEELLILEVRAREPLWNFQLNIQERNSKITNKLWEEVSLALGNKISAEGAKQKFKSLHDTYRKIIQAENLPSGSAKKSSKKWHHYDAMNFLRDSCLIKQTTSNLCSTVVECASNSGNENNTSLNKSSRKRKRQNDLSDNALERIADALSTNQETTISVPPPPQVDEIDAFLIMLGHRIKKLPQEKQMEAMQNHLQLSFNYLKE